MSTEPNIDFTALPPAAETFTHAAPDPDVRELLRQTRELALASQGKPGVVFDIPPLVASEGAKFMRGEPSLFDMFTVSELTEVADSFNPVAPRDAEALIEEHMLLVDAAMRARLTAHTERQVYLARSEVEASARKLAGLP